MNKARALKMLRNVSISFLALLIVLVGGGVAYTWYVGEHPVQNSGAVALPAPAVKPYTVTPRKQDPNAVVSASVQTITSPIAAGSNASIMIKTNANAKCTIAVEYNKIASKDSGLVPKVADNFGLVEWTWTVESTAPLGSWPVKINCANAKNSAMVQNDLKVVRTVE